MNRCIFEYRTTPCQGFSDARTASSVCVYADGQVVWRNTRSPVGERVMAAVPELAEAIEAIVARHAGALSRIPDHLYNGTRDGAQVLFRFGGKEITAWSIRRTDPEEVRQRDPGYFSRYADNMVHENVVLDIFNEIVPVFNAHRTGIGLRTL